MTLQRWKPRGIVGICAAMFSLHSGLAGAIALSGCSSQNTGTQLTSSHYMSDGRCSDTCKGSAFAITQGQNCWCSDSNPATSVSISECSDTCPGYPYEFCGNSGAGLYGYVALALVPFSPTGYSFPSAAPTSAAPTYVAPTSAAPIVPATSILVSTSIIETPTTAVEVSVVTSVPSSAPPISTVTPSASVITSAEVVTVSGAVVTQFVTSIPSASSPQSSTGSPKVVKEGLSGGAVAGIAIGSVIGALGLAALALFCFWRRRRGSGDTEKSGMSRNPSVLSRSGLLGGNRSRDRLEMTTPEPVLLPRIRTTGIATDGGLNSAGTASSEHTLDRRASRPLFMDNRLNPNALTSHPNLSRTSITTLQDNQDYSRPLEVRNPDEH